MYELLRGENGVPRKKTQVQPVDHIPSYMLMLGIKPLPHWWEVRA